jgi:undecaprenyl-diphosphatase
MRNISCGSIGRRRAACVFALCCVSFCVLAFLSLRGYLALADAAVYAALRSLSSPGLTLLMRAASAAGSLRAYLCAAAVLAALMIFAKRTRRLWASAAAVLGSAALLNIALKHLFARPRPDVARLVAVRGYSFPSGHSMISCAFCGFLAYMCVRLLPRPHGRIAAALLAALVLLIGLSRVYLGAHYFSDVICGLLAGAAIAACAAMASEIRGTE